MKGTMMIADIGLIIAVLALVILLKIMVAEFDPKKIPFIFLCALSGAIVVIFLGCDILLKSLEVQKASNDYQSRLETLNQRLQDAALIQRLEDAAR